MGRQDWWRWTTKVSCPFWGAFAPGPYEATLEIGEIHSDQEHPPARPQKQINRITIMNIRTITLAAVTLALGTGPLLAKPTQETPPRFYETSHLYLNDHPTIKEGVARSTVELAIGRPLMKVTKDIWIYPYGFGPANDQAKSDGCRELLIVFVNNRVSQIYFINEDARKIVQARAKAGESDPDVVLATVSPIQKGGYLASK